MRKQIAQNKRNTILIMLVFIAFIALIGWLFAWLHNDYTILAWFIAVSAGYALFQYFLADKIAIASAGAREISESDNPRYYKIVQKLAKDAKFPMPRVYIINDSAPNAFATGRNPEHASVAATTGLLDVMDDRELRAVMGHEMSHVKNYDIRISMITFGLVCVIGFLSDIGVRIFAIADDRDNDRSPVGLIAIVITSILAPIAAAMAQMAVSRQREYLADISSVKLTRYPEGMISALKKLDEHSRPMRRQNSATEAMWINNPLKKGFMNNLFSTHPSIESRIERLENAKHSF